jgi:hypothetical protein
MASRGRDVDRCAAAWRRPSFFHPHVAWWRRAIFSSLRVSLESLAAPPFSPCCVAQSDGASSLLSLLAQRQPSTFSPCAAAASRRCCVRARMRGSLPASRHFSLLSVIAAARVFSAGQFLVVIVKFYNLLCHVRLTYVIDIWNSVTYKRFNKIAMVREN